MIKHQEKTVLAGEPQYTSSRTALTLTSHSAHRSGSIAPIQILKKYAQLFIQQSNDKIASQSKRMRQSQNIHMTDDIDASGRAGSQREQEIDQYITCLQTS